MEAHGTEPSAASSARQSNDSNGSTAYPPAAGGSPGTVMSRGRRGAGIQERLFGRRGVTALTVAAGDLSKQDSSPSNTAPAAGVSLQQSAERTKPPRWQTPEFIFYGIVVAIMVPYMAWVPIELSSEDNPNFLRYSRYLKRGWLFGRLRDDSDFQYRSFRDYVPLLFLIMVIYVGLGRLIERLLRDGDSSRGSYRQVGEASAQEGRPRPGRYPFLIFWTAAFVLALHGTNTIKLLACCGINYAIAKGLAGTPLATPSIWIFNTATLFAVHYYEGFEFSRMHSAFSFLDGLKGLLPRWQINYNITMLRLVSFALDYHWAKKASTTSATANGAVKGDSDSRARAATSHSLPEYDFVNYLLYALYPPLFIAGPIMTFNDFYSQLRRPLVIPGRVLVSYAIRFFVCLLTMEFILHFMYVNAMKEAEAWYGNTPLQLSLIGFWNLIIVWLKLLIPWRFFRLWAIADGVDAPENMIRCMANNYSTLGFWRSWHRSYNLWVVRYIYVPVGGAKRAIPATLLVFTFVGLWHDLSLKLLTWAWLVTFFIVPELTCRAIFTEKKYSNYWWYRHLCAFGGVLNVLLMMTANLVGFVIGMKGIQYMWEKILSSREGLSFLLGASATLFVGVQVMFEYREEELRRGISRKC